MAKINLTTPRIAALTCTSGQSFLWDLDTPGLGVRATPDTKAKPGGEPKPGKKAFIVQSRFAGKVIRITIADVGTITVEDARTEASRLILLIRQGIDPREQKRQIVAEQEAAKEARKKDDAVEQVKSLSLGEVWALYVEERRPYWGNRHFLDHVRLAQAGGDKARKGDATIKPGPLAPLMRLSLAELNSDRIEAWLRKESESRPTQARMAYSALKTFLNWCGAHDQYKTIVGPDVLPRRSRDILPKKSAKADSLQKEQLPGWFAAVRQIGNPVIAAYLQALLLTGARREELAELKWEDVDFRWKSLTIKDKVEGQRVIPLTPFVESLLRFLPRRNQWVFSSPAAASGRIQETRKAHNKALAVAGIEHLTLHGLRRSFGSLGEWCEMPVGIVAQIMGHKPSATAERHYRVRPLDLLRMWHTKFESWILEQAEINILAREAQARTLSVAV